METKHTVVFVNISNYFPIKSTGVQGFIIKYSFQFSISLPLQRIGPIKSQFLEIFKSLILIHAV